MENNPKTFPTATDANSSSLKSNPFKPAQELIDKFNDPQATEVDKAYLKAVILTILSVFESQSAKAQSLVETLTPLALANDQDVYPALINLLGSEVNKVEILVNNFTLKALTQAVWMNEKQLLNIEALKRLLNIALNKINLNAANLTLFGDMFDAMGNEFFLKTRKNPAKFSEIIRFLVNQNISVSNFANEIKDKNISEIDQYRIARVKKDANSNPLSKFAIIFVNICAYLDVDNLSSELLKKLFEKLPSPEKNNIKFKTLINYLRQKGFLHGLESSYKLDKETQQLLLTEHKTPTLNLLYIKKAFFAIDEFTIKRTMPSDVRNKLVKEFTYEKRALVSHADSLWQKIYMLSEHFIHSSDSEMLAKFVELSNSLGLLYATQNRFKPAIQYLEQASLVIQNAKLSFLNDLVSTDKAVSKKAQQEIKQNNYRKKLVEIYAQELLHNIGNIKLNIFEYKLEELNKIISILERSLKLQKALQDAENINHNSSTQFTQCTLAHVYRDQAKIVIGLGKKAEAKPYLDQAKAQLESLGAINQQTKKVEFPNLTDNIKQAVILDLATIEKITQDIAEANKNYETAINNFTSALGIAQATNSVKDQANILIWSAETYRNAAMSSVDENKKKTFLQQSSETLLSAFLLSGVYQLFLTEIIKKEFNSANIQKIYCTIDIQNLIRIYDNFLSTLKAEDHIGLALKFSEYTLQLQDMFYEKEHFHYRKTQEQLHELKKIIETRNLTMITIPIESLMKDKDYLALKFKSKNNISVTNYLKKGSFLLSKMLFEQARYNYLKAIELAKAKHQESLITKQHLTQYYNVLANVGKYEQALAQLEQILPDDLIWMSYIEAFYRALIV